MIFDKKVQEAIEELTPLDDTLGPTVSGEPEYDAVEVLLEHAKNCPWLNVRGTDTPPDRGRDEQ